VSTEGQLLLLSSIYI